MLQNTLLTSPTKQSTGAAVNDRAVDQSPPKRQKTVGPQGSKVNKVRLQNGRVHHESSSFAHKPLLEFFQKHNCKFWIGYHTSLSPHENARLQYLAKNVDASKLSLPVADWFTKKLILGPDFQ